MSELSRMRSLRGAYKGHCTQDMKRAEKLLASETPDHAELKAVEDRLTRRDEEIARMDGQINTLLETEEDIERDTEVALTFHDTVSDCRFKIAELLKSVDNKPVSQFHFNNVEQAPPAHPVHINLPKISMRPFSGNPLEWLTFWDSFSAAIDRNPSVSNIDKMNYLNGMLKGEAARAIAGLPLTNENYEKAIDLLKERFGKTQVLINAYKESLSKFHGPPSSEIRALRTFYDTCETYIRGLQTLGVSTESYGSLLIPIILKKLPPEIRCLLFRADPQADVSLDRLRTAIQREIETQEKGYMPQSTEEQIIPTTSALLSGAERKPRSSSVRPQEPRSCIYCEGAHRAVKCDRINTSDERRSLLQRQHRCFNCLRTNHTSSQCFSKGRCRKCKQKHHTSICDEQELQRTSTSDPPKEKPSTTPENTSKDATAKSNTHMGATYALHLNAHILMQCAVINTRGDTNNCCRAHAMFDTGSQRTFITKELKNQLKLKPRGRETLNITTFGATQGTKKAYDVVAVTLLTNNGEALPITALVTQTICPPLLYLPDKLTLPSELTKLSLACSTDTHANKQVDIIIGNDHYGQLITGRIMKTKNEALIATESKFGWLLSGPIKQLHYVTDYATCQQIQALTSEEEKLDDLLTKFWEINNSPDLKETQDDTLQDFNTDNKFNKETGRYVVRLPWKSNKQDLPNNFATSKHRLNSLRHSLLKKDPSLIEAYSTYIEDQLNLGFIERVHDPSRHEGTLHYIPHFPVFKSDSATTKMRVVYDASARQPKALSLNDCLYTGPNLMQELQGILLRFRTHQIAFTADIEKAFLQIELNKLDRDATRFLWFKDTSKPANAQDNIDVYRFCRVLFGAAPSPFLLEATIRYHLNTKEDDNIAKDLQQSMYMENVVTGTSTEDLAVKYYTTSRKYLSEAGMNLRQWTSNSLELTRISRDENTSASPIVKVLGLRWDSESDTLSLSLENFLNETKRMQKITKRTVLSTASKLFDPLGLVEPVTVKAKIMIQDLWKQKITWDEILPDNEKQQWLKWLQDLNKLSLLRIPRQYLSVQPSKRQLHVFCDSSQKAFGAIAYLRGISKDNAIHTAFIMAKTRVAPIKTQTLPRLELSAMLLGTELSAYLVKTLNINDDACETFLWSDSTIALSCKI